MTAAVAPWLSVFFKGYWPQMALAYWAIFLFRRDINVRESAVISLVGTSGVGSGARSGICHSWSADGRCISLLKILLSNDCLFDCAYCLSRGSNDLPRATFTPEEVADLTINFYLRNYIEGLFLSSAVYASPDKTMADMVAVCRLRQAFSTKLRQQKMGPARAGTSIGHLLEWKGSHLCMKKDRSPRYIL